MKYSILALSLLLSITNDAQKPSRYDSVMVISNNNHNMAIDSPTKYRIIEIVGDEFEDSVLENLTIFNQIHTIRLMGMEKMHDINSSLLCREGLRVIEISYCPYLNYDTIFSHCHFEQIEHVSIAHCQLSKIPAEIAKMKNIKSLTLDKNNISDWDTLLFDLNRLEMLSIHSNHLTNIPTSIAKLGNLCTLRLFSNPIFKDKNREYIESFIHHLQSTRIENLNIANTNLQHFPNNLDELPFISFVNLAGNPIKHIGKQHFKTSVHIVLADTKIKYNKRLFTKLSPALP